MIMINLFNEEQILKPFIRIAKAHGTVSCKPCAFLHPKTET